MPAISIIIPVYKAESYLRRCLDKCAGADICRMALPTVSSKRDMPIIPELYNTPNIIHYCRVGGKPMLYLTDGLTRHKK